MGMTITQMPCNPGNYTAKRTGARGTAAPHYIKFCVKGVGANLTATLTPK